MESRAQHAGSWTVTFSRPGRWSYNLLDARHRGVIDTEIKSRLCLNPMPEPPTINCFPMEPNETSAWEMRCPLGLRIYYDPDPQERIVTVQLIGRKIGNEVWVGDQVIEL